MRHGWQGAAGGDRKRRRASRVPGEHGRGHGDRRLRRAGLRIRWRAVLGPGPHRYAGMASDQEARQAGVALIAMIWNRRRMKKFAAAVALCVLATAAAAQEWP